MVSFIAVEFEIFLRELVKWEDQLTPIFIHIQDIFLCYVGDTLCKIYVPIPAGVIWYIDTLK